ncbi:hypothetical protein DNJ95_13225 [Stutzerimonas kirkiae]|uniref:Nickel/cobalt transporter regulator n=1 Tax=Stutzerimonas kirkiae TaxID=2211392 RepID=A0A4V2KCY4_9GAMM|nr:anti-virulence regulator CigR family protein [Stutzerimonas kirkiae]TBU96820.1 hypothetical protein DNJ96_09655 [Stutzerimonas kirkiae]TBV01059.1 hypothetical protein DNJ95_13225 [Stutzerimonas kirkiae]
MRHHRIAIALGLTLLSGSLLLQAAPQQQQQQQQQNGQSNQPQQTGNKQPQKNSGNSKQQQPTQSQKSGQSGTSRQSPPKDFTQVHQAFHERRAQIGKGPSIPTHVQIRQGQPLPQGYGKRLDSQALHGLPQYQGYEWRRVGSDVVLIAITTGIVYTILQGVLN